MLLVSGGGGIHRRHPINVCCTSFLISTVASSTVVVTSVKQEQISKVLSQVGQSISGWFESSPSQSPQTVTHPFDPTIPFTSAYSFISTQSQALWSSLSPTLLELKTFLSTFNIVKQIVLGFFDTKIFTELFKKLDLKIKNIFELMFVKSTRDNFATLFDSTNWKNTQETAGLLLGLQTEISKYLTTESNLLNYLLLKLIDNPDQISKDFKSLTDQISKKKDHLSGKKQKPFVETLKYSLNLNWLNCVIGSPSLWWRCSNDQKNPNQRNSLVINSLGNFFNSSYTF